MLKKLVSYGLISVMSLGILAACGTTDDDEAEPTVTRAATSNAPAIATATAEGESAATAVVQEGEEAAEETAAEEGGEDAGAGDATGGPVELTVSAIDIAYEEKTLEGPADTEFTITITNNGAAQHDFVIDELGIKTALLNPGESETVTINAPAGEYTYYCSVPGHRAAGMEGTLTLAAGGGAAAAPAGDEAAATDGEATAQTEEEGAAAPAGDQAAGGPVELTVSAIDIAYEEKTLEGPADTEFTITITNNGMTQHDFVIDELGIKTALLNPGQSETVTINAPAGDYTYYCSVPGHRAAGMEGTLTLSAGGGAAAAPAGEEAATDEGAATAQADSAAVEEATAQADGAAAPAGDQAAAGPVELTVSAIDIAYEEKTLEGPADTEFTITITNNGLAQHDFVIDELGIKTALLNPGQSETVTINAPAGDYTYYCSVPGHRAAGMEGTLTLAAGGGADAAPAGEDAEASPAASPAASPEASPAAGGDAAGATELTVSAIDIAYEEKTLEGAANTEITITITNNGMTQHDFVIDELGIKTALLNPGQSETVTINAPAGDYTYYCSVPGHRPAGMEGTLTLS